MKISKTLSIAFISVFLFANGLYPQTFSMFRCNISHSGIYNTVGVEKLPSVKWKFKTGGKIFSSPALYEGITYIGSGDSCLYAIDIKTGTQVWKFATGGEVHSSPAVYDGFVYFGSFLY